MSGRDIARELGERMCAAWGIDPTQCTAITVLWRPRELPTAVVELYLSESAVAELLTLSVAHRQPITLEQADALRGPT